MICHLCHHQASGQCRACLKFYCPSHGDGVCGPCAAHPPDAVPVAPVALAPVALAPACSSCRAPAADTCDDCKRPFCNRHGTSEPGAFFSDRTLRCNDCQASAAGVRFCLGLLVVGLLALFMFVSVGRPGR